MVKKKIDSRVRTIIENGVATGHRTMFVLVGDKGRDQVVNLHYMLSKATVKTRPSVLWCYKKELGFTTHKQKRMREIKKKMKRGLIDPDKDDPFELFISATDIRYTYYAETHKVLGNTYGMCVLQDFEAITPNILARTIETVEGGGIIILLLRTVKSVKQLYTMTMDVHSRYRTESHHDVVARFNERFLLSLKEMPACLMLDDTLDVLPWARQTLTIAPVPPRSQDELSPDDAKLKELQTSLRDTQPVGSLVAKAKTIDQARALLTFIEAISEKSLRSTVTLTAARGRGKSAALGLAIAAAVGYSYSNIFVTSPSPENLKTLFEFVFKGFDALGLQEHTDYELIQSSNPDFNKAVVRVNIFNQNHRQTIQYIDPQDAHKLGQAELVVIDEAAAIPLPVVKELLGPYLVFMASTINGYEGTGRSLSLKLIDQLRKQSVGMGALKTPSSEGAATTVSGSGNRVLREITLTTPIRYHSGDPVEAWLNALLCLDATSTASTVPRWTPRLDQCDLYCVNRDTLFSYNKVSEIFLQRLMALYVASHYKNSPNDLQLLSDAPAHRIFCLLGPHDPKAGGLPEILCVIQIALEGEISQESMQSGLDKGVRASGDLIPWTIAQQFQDNDFGRLSGARIVRIATHPDYQNMGYGSKAMELLTSYYEGKIQSLSEEGEISEEPESLGVDSIEELTPRTKLPPLLSRLTERKPERLDYLGVSFGLTQNLLKFWKRCGFIPVYIRQTPNDLTGEFTTILLRPLSSTKVEYNWLLTYAEDFKRRFLALTSFSFKGFSPFLALGVLDRAKGIIQEPKHKDLSEQELEELLTKFDLKRLQSYSRNLIDYHAIMDLIPTLAHLWFDGRLPVQLSALQSAVLLGVGLQHKSVDDVAKGMAIGTEGTTSYEVNGSQVLAYFAQTIRKFSKYFQDLQEGEIAKQMPDADDLHLEPTRQTLDEEQKEGGEEIKKKMKAEKHKLSHDNADGLLYGEKSRIAIEQEFKNYIIDADEEELEKAVVSKHGGIPKVVSLPRKQERAAPAAENSMDAHVKRKKHHHNKGDHHGIKRKKHAEE